jgi:hypothetical protein
MRANSIEMPVPRASWSTNSASDTTIRDSGRPVVSVSMRAMSAKVRAWPAVSGVVGPSKQPSSARIAAVASARSACVVQLTGPSSGGGQPPGMLDRLAAAR